MPRSGLKPWVKGQSGNRQGLSREVGEALRYARSKTKDALRVATALMMDNTVAAKDRLKACEIVLERGLGKAPQLNLNMEADGGQSNKKAVNVIARQVFLTLQRGDMAELADVIDIDVEPGDVKKLGQ